MSEPTTEATHVNSSGPEDQALGAERAAAAPCGCEGKLEDLERRALSNDRVLKVIGQLAIVCALGVVYLLWQSWAKELTAWTL